MLWHFCAIYHSSSRTVKILARSCVSVRHYGEMMYTSTIMYKSIYAYKAGQEDLGTWPSAIKSDCRIFLPNFSGVCVLVGLLQSIPWLD